MAKDGLQVSKLEWASSSVNLQRLSDDDCFVICIKLKGHAHVVFAILETIVTELEFGGEHVDKRSILGVAVGCVREQWQTIIDVHQHSKITFNVETAVNETLSKPMLNHSIVDFNVPSQWG